MLGDFGVPVVIVVSGATTIEENCCSLRCRRPRA